MSAIPLPKPDPEPPPAEVARPGTHDDADGWALLEALRRRLDDQGALGRKTQVQVSQLADSIATLVADQRRRSKWLNLNSFVAYVIFTIVVTAGFYALYRSRASELVEARDHARHERDLAAARADDATTKLSARERADATAWEAFQLLESGKRSEAAAKLAALGAQPLSRTERAVLAARAHETQVMEVDAALKSAAAAFKAGRFGDVIAPLEAALVGEAVGPRAGAMHYFLGVAYAKGNDLAKAIVHLTTAATTDTEHDDARFQLASALDRSGQYAKARSEYDQFATAHPQSSLAVFAMRRSATLARMPAVAAPKPSAPGAAAPVPGAKPMASPPAPKPGAATPAAPAGATTPTAPPKPAAPPAAQPTPAPAKPVPAPKPLDGEGSASATPMSTRPVDLRESMSTASTARDTARGDVATTDRFEREPRERPPTELPPAARAGSPTPSLPSSPVERGPAPSVDPPIDREPAPTPSAPEQL